MFNTTVEKSKKDVEKLSARGKELSETLKEAIVCKDALIDARESGSASKNSADELSKIRSRIEDINDSVASNARLLDKARQELDRAITEQRQSDEGELNSLIKSVMLFRKACNKELAEAIVGVQVLLNLTRGERFGSDLVQSVDHLFRNAAEDLTGPDTFSQIIKEIERLTKEKFEKSPLGKKELLEIKISSRKGLSISEEAAKLLSEAREEVAENSI